MSPRPGTAEPLLGPDDEARLRDAVTDAVLSAPRGLREAIEQDPEASLALVSASRVAAEETSRLLSEAVANARAAGHSWDAIGRLIGVSRQAAQQRFGPAGPPATTGPERRVGGDGPERRVLTPLTLFDEMVVLEPEARRGWHMVDFGPLYLVVEASDHAWQHRRAVWSPAAARALAEQGWQLVGGWSFPWGYYKRRLDLPAEP
ncbi:hypothetical protein [Jannaschia sp. R86511]|uniref:hypothetical protein n=1 Tax=Jannaschia sp. R86511 TaxID=3093853 RepID=UPI0036D25CC5